MVDNYKWLSNFRKNYLCYTVEEKREFIEKKTPRGIKNQTVGGKRINIIGLFWTPNLSENCRKECFNNIWGTSVKIATCWERACLPKHSKCVLGNRIGAKCHSPTLDFTMMVTWITQLFFFGNPLIKEKDQLKTIMFSELWNWETVESMKNKQNQNGTVTLRWNLGYVT